MNEHAVYLENTGRWNDDVGACVENTAMNAVRSFNEASRTIWELIEILAQYSMDDVQYESQRSNIEQMRVEYHG